MKIFVVCRDRLGVYCDEVDPEHGIVKNGGFLEYSTADEDISLDINDLIEIVFEM